MPPDFLGEEFGFLEKLLLVVFAEVEMGVWGGVQGEDVIGGFELGDGDEAGRGGGGGGEGGGDAGEDGGEVGGEGGGAGGGDGHFGGHGLGGCEGFIGSSQLERS